MYSSGFRAHQHLRSLAPVVNEYGWIWWPNDIRGPWCLKLPDICLTGEEKPRENLTQEICPDRESNPRPLRDRRACYHLFHSGGRNLYPSLPWTAQRSLPCWTIQQRMALGNLSVLIRRKWFIHLFWYSCMYWLLVLSVIPSEHHHFFYNPTWYNLLYANEI